MVLDSVIQLMLELELAIKSLLLFSFSPSNDSSVSSLVITCPRVSSHIEYNQSRRSP